MTSLLSIACYIYLTFKFNSKYYSYASALASISLALSTVKIFGLENDYYILMGIISSYILLGISLLSKPSKNPNHQLLYRPLELTAYITLPMSLTIGALSAVTTQSLFTFQAVLSIFLGALFYGLVYYTKKNSEFFIAFLGLLLGGIYLAARWLHSSETETNYIMLIVLLVMDRFLLILTL
jgi:hypothetical protein